MLLHAVKLPQLEQSHERRESIAFEWDTPSDPSAAQTRLDAARGRRQSVRRQSLSSSSLPPQQSVSPPSRVESRRDSLPLTRKSSASPSVRELHIAGNFSKHKLRNQFEAFERPRTSGDGAITRSKRTDHLGMPVHHINGRLKFARTYTILYSTSAVSCLQDPHASKRLVHPRLLAGPQQHLPPVLPLAPILSTVFPKTHSSVLSRRLSLISLTLLHPSQELSLSRALSSPRLYPRPFLPSPPSIASLMCDTRVGLEDPIILPNNIANCSRVPSDPLTSPAAG